MKVSLLGATALAAGLGVADSFAEEMPGISTSATRVMLATTLAAAPAADRPIFILFPLSSGRLSPFVLRNGTQRRLLYDEASLVRVELDQHAEGHGGQMLSVTERQLV